jgi:hypothetical protein
MKANFSYKIGAVYPTNEGFDILIIDVNIKSPYKVKIRFLDYMKHEIWVDRKEIRTGSIKNPFYKTVCGVGYYGAGVFKSRNGTIKKTAYYTIWSNLIRRCYDKECKEYKIYGNKNVTVCEEWHNFQNFAKWYHETFPFHITGIKFQIDKDLLQQGIENKIYSPKTCIWLPSRINSFIANNHKSINKSGYTGVCWSEKLGKYMAQINNFNNSKRIRLGDFKSIEDANKSYIEGRKIEAKKAKEFMKNLGIYNEYIINLIV